MSTSPDLPASLALRARCAGRSPRVGADTHPMLSLAVASNLGSGHRCLAEVEFTALATEEASRWLARAGSGVRVAQPTTIAECYALLDGRAEPPRVKQYGFAA